LAPSYLALENDPVGLQVGDSAAPLQKVLVTLEVTPATIREACRLGANLVISHHPLIFKPLKAINFRTPEGDALKTLLKEEIHLLVAHTNLDVAPRGLNYYLGRLFDLDVTGVLQTTFRDRLIKLVVFVPEGYQEQVREAISEAGAGWIGGYSHCTFQTAGTGTFMPREGTSPFQGKKDRLEKVNEIRLETVLPASLVQPVTRALQDRHPYEEVAFDLYPLENKGIDAGLGVVGILPRVIALEEMARRCKEVLNLEKVKVWGDLTREIRTVALCGGSGGSLVESALGKEVDLFISGDLKHHDVQEGLHQGMCLIDAGHLGTEEPVVNYLAKYLRQELRGQGFYHEVNTTSVAQAEREHFV